LTSQQPRPLIEDHSLIIDENGVRYFDYTKERMRAVAEDPNALSWVVKLLLRHLGLATRGRIAEAKTNLLAYCNDEEGK
jgi:hypothetical protein